MRLGLNVIPVSMSMDWLPDHLERRDGVVYTTLKRSNGYPSSEVEKDYYQTLKAEAERTLAFQEWLLMQPEELEPEELGHELDLLLRERYWPVSVKKGIETLEQRIASGLFSKEDILQALEAHIHEVYGTNPYDGPRMSPDSNAERSLEIMAYFDHPKAMAVAHLLRQREEEEHRVDLLAMYLTQFPTNSDMEQWLDELGFVPSKVSHRLHSYSQGEEQGYSTSMLVNALSRRGRLFQTDMKPGNIPAVHPFLLHQMATIVSPELDGIVFSQKLLCSEDELFEDERCGTVTYTLQAWWQGNYFFAPALECGKHYCAQSCEGFVNSILETIGASCRIVGLLEQGYVAAPAEVLGREDWQLLMPGETF